MGLNQIFYHSEVLLNDQQNADAIYVKGLTLYYQDMSEKATKFFHQVLRLNPDHKPSQRIIKVRILLILIFEEFDSTLHTIYTQLIEV